MKALILAAGRGERMRPLTDHTPKPLLVVRGKPLIVWHIEALAREGVREIVVNTAWLEERIVEALGDGSRYGVRLHYSLEGRDHGGALETAGGMAKALPLLTDASNDGFWVVSGDVFLPGFRFDPAAALRFQQGSALAHLWLVPNAPHHPHGDFGITPQGLAALNAEPRYTWASVGLFRAGIVKGVRPGEKLPLTPLLRAGADAGQISAEFYAGAWTDVGTVERLDRLNAEA
ncbi:N-acetylmuramate alpha-1-phosphate uridylyltransferase MurU [Sphaerotilaceae bacterium SBD11-9]